MALYDSYCLCVVILRIKKTTKQQFTECINDAEKKYPKHTEQWFGISANIFAFAVAANSVASKCHYDIFSNK